MRTYIKLSPKYYTYIIFSLCSITIDSLAQATNLSSLEEHDYNAQYVSGAMQSTLSMSNIAQDIQDEINARIKIDRLNSVIIQAQHAGYRGKQFLDSSAETVGFIAAVPGPHSPYLAITAISSKIVAGAIKAGSDIVSNIADDKIIKAFQKLPPKSTSEAISYRLDEINIERQKQYNKLFKSNNRRIFKLTDTLHLTNKYKRQMNNYAKLLQFRKAVDKEVEGLLVLKQFKNPKFLTHIYLYHQDISSNRGFVEEPPGVFVLS